MWIHLREVLKTETLAMIRQALALAPWEPGALSAGSQAVTVKNNEQLHPLHPTTQDLQQQVLDALQHHAAFFSAALPRQIWPPSFNRYTGMTNAYGNHVDSAIRHRVDRGPLPQRLRADLSCTLFLSDPDTYVGGELVLCLPQGEQPIKLAAGDMVLYPSTYVHRVEPVVQGERLACFFWIESLVRDITQRQLLYELDLQIMALRDQHGESAITTSLMGTYHNLLRLWAHS